MSTKSEVKQEQIHPEFNFDITENQLIIDVNVGDITYTGSVEKHSLMSFDDIKSLIQQNQFKTVDERTKQVWKIKIAKIINLEMIGHEENAINLMKKKIKELNLKVKTQAEKNIELEERVNALEVQAQFRQTEFLRITEKLQQQISELKVNRIPRKKQLR